MNAKPTLGSTEALKPLVDLGIWCVAVELGRHFGYIPIYRGARDGRLMKKYGQVLENESTGVGRVVRTSLGLKGPIIIPSKMR